MRRFVITLFWCWVGFQVTVVAYVLLLNALYAMR
jgi:hypothetical protein